MSECLLSVGLDVGTTSTQMVFSRLCIENKAGSFAVPEMDIKNREILYKSPVHFTPLLEGDLVDADTLRTIVDTEYAAAGITKEEVDTGAIIITGETSRKENARAVLESLAGYAGEFVVATAGPDLESILAAKGAGATEYSERTGKTVLHMDIGGGTSNLALIEDGKIVATSCLNVGGRLLKIDRDGVLTYVSPVLEGIFEKRTGEVVNREEVYVLCEKLTSALEAAAGLREEDGLTEKLLTKGTVIANQSADWCGNLRDYAEYCGGLPRRASAPRNDTNLVISFSGGVADCIDSEKPWLAYGDMGPELGMAIRKSRLCRGEYILGKETIRATVIGAGCHSTQLSGSTVYHQNVEFPLKNIPAVRIADLSQLQEKLALQEGPVVLSLEGIRSPGYRQIRDMAQELAGRMPAPVFLCLEQDMAKALGQALAVRLPPDAAVLCIDRIRVEEGSFLDIGAPVGGALPVVVKTLVLSK